MSADLRQKTADALREAIRALAPGTPLAPVRELCRRYGVSAPTLCGALALLARDGFVRTRRGRRTVVADRGPPGPPGSDSEPPSPLAPSASQRLFDAIRDGIESGTYRAGEPLPKRHYFMLEYGVSAPTVGTVLKRLQAAGLIARRGRAWVAGRNEAVPAGRADGQPPTILLLCGSITHWEGICLSERTRLFGTLFELEAQRARIHLEPVFPERAVYSSSSLRLEALRDLVDRLGPRYLGALVAFPHARLAEYCRQIRYLLGRARPVVWFDRLDTPLGKEWRHPCFTRCHFSETAAVDEALRRLSAYGHRRIGYPVTGDDDWISRRGELLRQRGLAQSPPMQVLVTPPRRAMPDAVDTGALDAFYRMAVRKRTPLARELEALYHGDMAFPSGYATARPPPRGRDATRRLAEIVHAVSRAAADFPESAFGLNLQRQLAFMTPFLVHLLAAGGITAIVAPNDRHGRRVCDWLHMTGIAVPDRLSVVSFDNTMNKRQFASVDFGFDALGYAAFHLITGDVPVHRKRNGDVPARPRLVENRTLGPAPTGGGGALVALRAEPPGRSVRHPAPGTEG